MKSEKPEEKKFDAPKKENRKGAKRPAPNKNGVWTWILFGIAAILLVSIYTRPDIAGTQIPVSEFKNKIKSGEIKRVLISDTTLKGYTTTTMPQATGLGQVPTKYFVALKIGEDQQLLKLMDETEGLVYEGENLALKNLFWHWVLPFVVLLLIWRFLFARAFKMGPGAGLMSFGKNRGKLVADDNKKISFKDVAGVEEAKEELSEIIEFLTTPEKFRAIGGKIPKGILLIGPPGTGKTLLARAVSGEAKVPFFSLSGSEFVEMFVGVGAARVRDLFAQAMEKSPCIIFVDELDAIGKVRSAVSPMGGHDEREQTLNQLLVEMDGFDTRTGVIIMAATNRPETLDPALLRAGRFDRQVLVDRPDVNGREDILKIHSSKLKLAEKVDLRVVAARTPGFVGADLANVCNEAALLAVRKGKTKVELIDFDDAVDRVVAGLQKKSRLINQNEKEIVAHHETGHALVSCFTKGSDPVHKVSVIPRGMGALGFTLNLPKEDRYLMTREELLARIDVLYGGRVAEEVIFGDVSTGASDDLQKATDIAKRMVMEFGMSEGCGQRTYSSERQSFIPGSPGASPREFSDDTANKIDAEIRSILDAAYVRVTKLISGRVKLLKHVATRLKEIEVLESEELLRLIEEIEGPGTVINIPTPPEEALPRDAKKISKKEKTVVPEATTDKRTAEDDGIKQSDPLTQT